LSVRFSIALIRFHCGGDLGDLVEAGVAGLGPHGCLTWAGDVGGVGRGGEQVVGVVVVAAGLAADVAAGLELAVVELGPSHPPVVVGYAGCAGLVRDPGGLPSLRGVVEPDRGRGRLVRGVACPSGSVCTVRRCASS
jgi:hypothetical protein